MDKSPTQEDPRSLALWMLYGVLVRGETLADLEGTDTIGAAKPPVRARAGRLTRATLRNLAAADAALKPLLHRPPRADIRDILRLATVEMMVEGEAPHGVVHDAVTRARRRQSKSAGMVNAVLRQVADGDRDAFAALPARRLPGWLRGRLSSAYGNARVARMESLFMQVPPIDLTLRQTEDREPWADRLGAEVLPTGSLRLAKGGQISALEGFDGGHFWVQDAAAALPARILAPRRGERILDLCAAPGGKTLQLADAGAAVTALDISDARLERLRENLTRTRLSAEIVAADALTWAPQAQFDAILLDAPCTATGTLRRHPDLPFAKGVETLKSLPPLQESLIDRAVDWLAPGGRLVVCTCSLLPEEGEALRKSALARHESLLPDGTASAPGHDPAWRMDEGEWRITPESWETRGGIDGFYIAAFRKAEDS